MSSIPHKPILCLDFDGVLHSYTSPFDPRKVSDPPVPGAMAFLETALASFDLSIYSSRSGHRGGIAAMQEWLRAYLVAHGPRGQYTYDRISWPLNKPPAFLTIDDRALQFTGEWPDPRELLAFKPWNRR